jgi:orotate phosphoribosyltransferase
MREQIEKLLTDNGVMLRGHFLLTSGLHSGLYFEKFKILEKPQVSSLLCSKIALHFNSYPLEKVIGPTTGGTIIAYEVAKQLGLLSGMAEKSENNKRIIKRGSGVSNGEKILIVDDVLTTGGSVKDTINAVLEKKGDIMGIAVLIDRSEKPIDFGYPFYAVYNTTVKNYTKEDCPLCKDGIPLTRPGGV